MSMRPLRPAGPSPAPDATHPTAVVKQKACIPCRKRKVKCDKKTPCTNCASWELECVFPSPVRRCARSKRKASSNRSTTLTGDGDTDADERAVDVKRSSQSVDARLHDLEKALQEVTESLQQPKLPEKYNGVRELRYTTPNQTRQLKRLGEIEARMDELRSRGDKVEFGGAEPGFPRTGAFNNGSGCILQNINSGRLFPFNSFSVEVAPLHPSPAQSQACWQVFLENVDQLVKVLHRTSAETILQKAADGTCSLTKGQEALLFTVYFSSIISMTENDTKACFHMSKSTALMTYRSASEQALMRADFLTTHDLTTLQAFVLFLSFNLYVDDAKLVWALTGLARRLCRPVSTVNTSLSPFEQEIHRRLWWQLWFLDRRASEDQGRSKADGSPADGTIDPELPSNINDTDLANCMRSFPQSKEAWTEMTFSLIRYEIARTNRRISDDKSHILLPHEKENLINDCVSKIQSRYLRHCDGSHPIHWLAQHVAYVTVTELWIQLYDQIQDCWLFTPSPGNIQLHQMPQINRTQLFFATIDIVDVPKRLRTEPSGHKWKWLLKAYLQFLPLKFLLTELCRRLNETQESLEADFDEVNERARKVASFAFTRWTDENKRSENGQVLSRLMRETEEAWMARKERERITEQIWSAQTGDWIRLLDEHSLGLGGVPAALPAPEFDYISIIGGPHMEDMIATPWSSMDNNEPDLVPDPEPRNDFSWSVGNKSYPLLDGSVYCPGTGEEVGENIYSY